MLFTFLPRVRVVDVTLSELTLFFGGRYRKPRLLESLAAELICRMSSGIKDAQKEAEETPEFHVNDDFGSLLGWVLRRLHQLKERTSWNLTIKTTISFHSLAEDSNELQRAMRIAM